MTRRRIQHWRVVAAGAAISAALAGGVAIAQSEDGAPAEDEAAAQSGEKPNFAGLKEQIEAERKTREAGRKDNAETPSSDAADKPKLSAGRAEDGRKTKGSKDGATKAQTADFVKAFVSIFKEELKQSVDAQKRLDERLEDTSEISEMVDEALKSTWSKMKDAGSMMDGLTPELPVGPDKELLCLGTADPTCE